MVSGVVWYIIKSTLGIRVSDLTRWPVLISRNGYGSLIRNSRAKASISYSKLAAPGIDLGTVLRVEMKYKLKNLTVYEVLFR